jgi:hypothetical protein
MKHLGPLVCAVALVVLGLSAQLPSSAPAADLDCADFSSQAEAQENLLPGDPYGLDGDSDGIACEDNPCPCGSATGGGGGGGSQPVTPPPPPPYRLEKAAARSAARAVATRFADRNPNVSTAAMGACRRSGERRVDCFAVARGRTSTNKTTCQLRVAVRAVNRHPRAKLASSRCRTQPTIRLTAAKARMAIRTRASELADKPVAVVSLERAGTTSFRGLAEWTQTSTTLPVVKEECFALMEAALSPIATVTVSLIETDCRPLLVPDRTA